MSPSNAKIKSLTPIPPCFKIVVKIFRVLFQADIRGPDH